MSLTIAVLGVCLSVATFLIGRQSTAKTDGQEMGTIKNQLICLEKTMERIENSINSGLSTLNSKVDMLEKDMAEVKASARSAHKRIDELVHKG